MPVMSRLGALAPLLDPPPHPPSKGALVGPLICRTAAPALHPLDQSWCDMVTVPLLMVVVVVVMVVVEVAVEEVAVNAGAVLQRMLLGCLGCVSLLPSACEGKACAGG